MSCTGMIRMLIASICAMLLHGSDAPVPFFSQLLAPHRTAFGLAFIRKAKREQQRVSHVLQYAVTDS